MIRSISRFSENENIPYKDCRVSSHYSLLEYESFENPAIPYNPNTLFFKDNSLNLKLVKALYCDRLSHRAPSKEFKSNLLSFYTFYNVFLLIMLSFAILMQASGDLSQSMATFHIVFLILLAFLANLGLFFIYKLPKFLLYSRLFFFTLAVLTYLYLILSNEPVLKSITQSSGSYKSLPSSLGIICLTVFLRLILFDAYFLFTISCAITNILFITLNLAYSRDSIYTALSEFCVILLFMILSIIDCQVVDIRTRQLFYRYIKEIEATKEHNNEDSPHFQRKQTLLSLAQRCQTVKKELKYVKSVMMYQDLKRRIRDSIINIEFIEKNLESETENFILENNQNIDEEDKQFISQNYTKNTEIKLKRRDLKSMTIIEMPEKQPSSSFKIYGIAEIENILGSIGKNWNFDIWFIYNTTGHSISIIGKYLFQKWNILDFVHTTQSISESFFECLEKGYLGNPYHNACHAADVCHSLMYFILQSDLCKSMTPLDLLVCIVSSLSHDLKHPGVTNRYLINIKDSLAIEYNDLSVLENMHCSSLFGILKNPLNNILLNQTQEEWTVTRKLIIKMILETDMARHFEITAKFKAKYLNLDLQVLDEKAEVLAMALKCADIAHSAKFTDLHEKWTQLVCEEFFKQGDLEKANGLTVSMYCDRETTDIAKSQAGFIKNICMPLYDLWCGYLNTELILSSCLKQMEKNQIYWDDKFKERKASAQLNELIPEPPLLRMSLSVDSMKNEAHS